MRRRHRWVRERGGHERCDKCAVVRVVVTRVVSSVFGRPASIDYFRSGEKLHEPPRCVDDRQLGLFDVRPDDG